MRNREAKAVDEVYETSEYSKHGIEAKKHQTYLETEFILAHITNNQALRLTGLVVSAISMLMQQMYFKRNHTR